MPAKDIKEFLEENIANLKSEDSNGGKRFFTPYKEAIGKVGEDNLDHLIDYCIIKQDIFAQATLNPRIIRKIILILTQLDVEILSIALKSKRDLTLDDKEIATLKCAYQFAFISRFNAKVSDIRLAEKAKQLFSLMKMVSDVSAKMLEGKDEKTMVNEISASFVSLTPVVKVEDKSGKSEDKRIDKKEKLHRSASLSANATNKPTFSKSSMALLPSKKDSKSEQTDQSNQKHKEGTLAKIGKRLSFRSNT